MNELITIPMWLGNIEAVSLNGQTPICIDKNCSLRQECAQHEFSEKTSIMTPDLHYCHGVWKCSQIKTALHQGPLYFSDTRMRLAPRYLGKKN